MINAQENISNFVNLRKLDNNSTRIKSRVYLELEIKENKRSDIL